MEENVRAIFQELVVRHPKLAVCEPAISLALSALTTSFEAGGKLLVCGNGGSGADCEHIVGELMKSFKCKRPVRAAFLDEASRLYGSDQAGILGEVLEGALPAISLVSQSALLTAFSNDKSPEYAFAQQVFGYGHPGDVLLAISTSGNSRNVVMAAKVARVLKMSVIALTGERESLLSGVSDISITVPETETFMVQELHLPVYHALCAALEARFFDSSQAFALDAAVRWRQ